MVSLPPAPNRACPQPGETISSHTERNSQASPPSPPTIKKPTCCKHLYSLEINHPPTFFFRFNLHSLPSLLVIYLSPTNSSLIQF